MMFEDFVSVAKQTVIDLKWSATRGHGTELNYNDVALAAVVLERMVELFERESLRACKLVHARNHVQDLINNGASLSARQFEEEWLRGMDKYKELANEL